MCNTVTDDTAVCGAISIYRASLDVPAVMCCKAKAGERGSLFRIVRVRDGEGMALFLILTSKRWHAAGPLFSNCSFHSSVVPSVMPAAVITNLVSKLGKSER